MSIKVICFDVDGTLLDDGDGSINIWNQIHQRAGTPQEENDRRFEQFMSGGMTYAEWVDIDIRGWQEQGIARDVFESVVSEMSLMPGARECAFELADRGYGLGVISGSLNIGIESLFPDHPFDPVYINGIFFGEDGLVSRWEATPFDLQDKPTGLRLLAEEKGVGVEECAFIGDNFNDVDAAAAAGFSIAFNSKSEALDAVADVIIREKDLRQVLEHFPPIESAEGRVG